MMEVPSPAQIAAEAAAAAAAAAAPAPAGQAGTSAPESGASTSAVDGGHATTDSSGNTVIPLSNQNVTDSTSTTNITTDAGDSGLHHPRTNQLSPPSASDAASSEQQRQQHHESRAEPSTNFSSTVGEAGTNPSAPPPADIATLSGDKAPNGTLNPQKTVPANITSHPSRALDAVSPTTLASSGENSEISPARPSVSSINDGSSTSQNAPAGDESDAAIRQTAIFRPESSEEWRKALNAAGNGSEQQQQQQQGDQSRLSTSDATSGAAVADGGFNSGVPPSRLRSDSSATAILVDDEDAHKVWKPRRTLRRCDSETTAWPLHPSLQSPKGNPLTTSPLLCRSCLSQSSGCYQMRRLR